MPLSRSLVSRTFAVGNALLAGLLLWAAFGGLTVRDAWVDVPAVLLALMLLASTAGLLRNAPWPAISPARTATSANKAR